MGATNTSLQACRVEDLLNRNIDNGTLSCCPHSLGDNIDQPSGPDALAGLKVDNLA